jgi:hypothetical protein
LGQVERLPDEVLEARVYGPPTPPTHHRVVPDCAYLHAERRKPGVTLELRHLEYLEQHPDGYRYTQFCEFYRRWLERRRLSMRQLHRAGDKCFVLRSNARREGLLVKLARAVEIEDPCQSGGAQGVPVRHGQATLARAAGTAPRDPRAVPLGAAQPSGCESRRPRSSPGPRAVEHGAVRRRRYAWTKYTVAMDPEDLVLAEQAM